jgi:hypothetical protein
MIQPNSPDDQINGSIAIRSVLILYNTVTQFNNYSYNVSTVTLQQWTMDRISYTISGNIVGSWSYRIPIYITVSELPILLTETGFVFRLELPISDWVRSGLLSSGLEDLMIVDSASRPLLFYIYKIKDDGKGVIYVRYDSVITSNTLVIYVLLQNKQLWGSGRTFSTLSVFDYVNLNEFVDDFGYNVFYSYLTYNALLVTVTDLTHIKFGKTWYDFVYINRSNLVEQHGSTTFYNTTLPTTFSNDDELLIYINRNDYDNILIFKNAQPFISFKLSDYLSNPAYYVGYKNTKSVYVFRMLLYSYSIGQLVGGYQNPPQVTKTNTVTPTQTQTTSIDWWSLFLMIFAVMMISIAVKWMNESGGGSDRRPIKLP